MAVDRSRVETLTGAELATPVACTAASADRPVIFDFDQVSTYLQSMLAWQKKTVPHYSVRREVKKLSGCSPSLITRLTKGERRLTRDRIDDVAKVLRLTAAERTYLDRWVAAARKPKGSRSLDSAGPKKQAVPSASAPQKGNRWWRSKPQNHLLNDWLNIYVKDAARLKRFAPSAERLHQLLGGIATVSHIRRSLDFLIREGFLRRTLDGQVVKNDFLTYTTDDIPNDKIRAFHKKALAITQRNIDLYPIEMRHDSAMVLPVNRENLGRLRDLLKEFHERVVEFAEDHPDDNEQLYQVLINLTPIGGRSE